MQIDLEIQQLSVCERFNATPVPAEPHLKVGIARNVREGLQPIHGLRCGPDAGTTGWFFWAGDECSEAPDFFVPLHVEHLYDWCPQVLPYLRLPPGWRILLAPGYEDVWYDPSLLEEK